MSSFKEKLEHLKEVAEAKYSKCMKEITNDAKIIEIIKSHKDDVQKIIEEVENYIDECKKTGGDGIEIAKEIYHDIFKIKRELNNMLLMKK
ncbi:MAG: hypothetical protein QF775_00985 [archaeon]|jgi:hypothetical protein|nr:hypothetical protein [archaeon]